MVIYTVNDSQGHCVGVFDNLTQAKDYLIGWAESICDNPTIIDLPTKDLIKSGQSIACIYDDYPTNYPGVSNRGRFLLAGNSPEYNVGEYTIEQWALNEGV